MTYVPMKRGTLLIPCGTSDDPDRKHLFVIVTDACADGFHLLLSISSIKDSHHDATCELEVGEHDFITKRSFVWYARPDKLRAALLLKCVDGWVYTPKAELGEPVFARACAGIQQSNFTPRWAKTYFRRNS